MLELLRSSPSRIVKIFLKTDRHDTRFNEIRTLAETSQIPIATLDDNITGLIDADSHRIANQGIIAQIADNIPIALGELLAACGAAPLPLILALDQVQDPGNLGALARSAYALGCAGFILPLHNSAASSPASLKASAGALNYLPISVVTNLAHALDEAETLGFSIYGAGFSPLSISAYDISWQLPAILVLGSEENGIRPGVAKRCQNLVHIPMSRTFDSLNVAQAGGMLIALCAAQICKK